MAGYAGVGGQRARLAGDRQLGVDGLCARKRIRWRHSQEVHANPLAARGGRGVGGIDAVLMFRSQHQDAALAEKAGSLGRRSRGFGKGNAAELGSADTRNVVMSRELLVEESVIG